MERRVSPDIVAVPPRTSAQQREIVESVMSERFRCTAVVQTMIARLGGEEGPPDGHPDRVVWAILTDLRDRIRRPWKERHATRRLRPVFCCGRCGGEGHTAPSKKCPARQGTAP